MRSPQFDRIMLRSNFTLSFECEVPLDHFIAKLTVSRCFAIHDRRSMWSACHLCLFRPGLLLRPSTPLNNPPTLLLLSTALLHIHLFLVRLPSSFFSHSQLLSQSFSLSRHAFRKRWQRTQVLPVELINLLLGYNRGDEVPTHRGTLSVRATGERLMRARSVDPGRDETERPLHASGLLYYVPDAVLDAAVPAPDAASPVRSAPIPRRSPSADPGAPIRAMEVDSRRRTPVVPRRPLPALT